MPKKTNTNCQPPVPSNISRAPAHRLTIKLPSFKRCCSRILPPLILGRPWEKKMDISFSNDSPACTGPCMSHRISVKGCSLVTGRKTRAHKATKGHSAASCPCLVPWGHLQQMPGPDMLCVASVLCLWSAVCWLVTAGAHGGAAR